MRPKIERPNCKNCGKKLTRLWSVGKRAVFCSVKCSKQKQFHPRWNGGKTLDKDGYVKVRLPDNLVKNTNRYVREHRWIMENELGRKLLPEEIIHHKNGNRTDNRMENLQITTFQKHSKKHIMERIKNGTWRNPNPSKFTHGFS